MELNEIIKLLQTISKRLEVIEEKLDIKICSNCSSSECYNISLCKKCDKLFGECVTSITHCIRCGLIICKSCCVAYEYGEIYCSYDCLL